MLLQNSLQFFCYHYLFPMSFWHRIFCCPVYKRRCYRQPLQVLKEYYMETRIAVIAIIVEDRAKSEELNRILHEYGEYVVGRMGVPYREKGISVISVILDAPQEKISALSGRLGMLKGVSSKTVYSKTTEKKV